MLINIFSGMISFPKRLSGIILLSGFIFTAFWSPAATLADSPSGKQTPEKEWTLMVYIAGDNNLEEAVVMDLLEMEQGKNDNTEILVFIDRSKGYYQDWQNWHGARLYRVRKNPALDMAAYYENKVPLPAVSSEMLQDLGELDSGNPKVAEEFLKYAAVNFPAKRYAFIAWDHGGGWPLLLQDEGSGSFMSSGSFAEALRRGIKTLPSGKLDLLIMDMCLMGQLDALYNFRDIAEYTVASAQIVPGLGMDYAGFLKHFRPGVSTRKTGEGIVNASIEFYNRYPKEATFSLYDMSKAEPLTAVLKPLTAELKRDSSRDTYRQTRSITDSFHYGQKKIYNDFEDQKNTMSSIDLDDWLNHLLIANPAYRNSITDIKAKIRDFMVYTKNSDTYKFTKGLALYAPVSRGSVFPNYDKNPFSEKSGFGEYFAELYKNQELHGRTDPFFSDIEIGIPEIRPGEDPANPASFDLRSVNSITPLTQTALRFAVNGENILWSTLAEAVKYQDRPDRIYINHKQLLVDLAKQDRLDASLIQNNLSDILPDYADGKTVFLREFTGQIYQVTNGTDIFDITVDHTNTEFDTITTTGWYYNPALGQEVRVNALFDTKTLLLSGLYHYDLGKEIVVRPGGYFRPETDYLTKSNGQLAAGTETQPRISFNSNDELFLALSNIPDGARIAYILRTETMGGKSATEATDFLPVTNSPEQQELIAATGRNLAALRGRYTIGYYARTARDGLNLLPTFDTISFDFDDSQRPRQISWATRDKKGIGLLNYLLKPQGLTPPELILYREPDARRKLETLASYEVFIDSQGQDRVIYLIELGAGTRIALYPLDGITAGDFEGEWRGDTQTWIFKDNKVTMIYNGEHGKKGTYTGTYDIHDSFIRLNWNHPFKDFAFIIDKNQDRIILKPHEKLLFGGEKIIPGTKETASELGKKLSGAWVMTGSGFNTGLEISGIPGRKYLRLRFSGNGAVSEAVGAITGSKLLLTFSDGRKMDPEYSLAGAELLLKLSNGQEYRFTRSAGK